MPFQGPPPGFYPPPPNAPKTTNWWAVVSLIFGVIGGVLISVICGIVGLNKAKQGQGGRGMAIAGLVLSGLWVLVAIAAVAIYFIVGKGTVTATDVKVGDCLKEIPDGTRVLTVETVECGESHAGEVFAVLLMPEGDFPANHYPWRRAAAAGLAEPRWLRGDAHGRPTPEAVRMPAMGGKADIEGHLFVRLHIAPRTNAANIRCSTAWQKSSFVS